MNCGFSPNVTVVRSMIYTYSTWVVIMPYFFLIVIQYDWSRYYLQSILEEELFMCCSLSLSEDTIHCDIWCFSCFTLNILFDTLCSTFFVRHSSFDALHSTLFESLSLFVFFIFVAVFVSLILLIFRLLLIIR